MGIIDDGFARLREQRHPHRIRLIEHHAVETPKLVSVALDALPALIQERTLAYLADPAPGRALLLALPAGSGKTTAMVALAEAVASQGRRVIYSGPRHDLFDDLMAMSERRDWWYHWQPRRLGDEEQETTCRWAPQMERWLARGYEAMKFCANPRICGWTYINNSCPYHRQKGQTRPIIYAQHQHIAVGHPLMEQSSLVIGDELPLGAFLHPWLIPASHIVVKECPREIENLLWTIRSLCSATAPDGGWSGPALLHALGGAQHIVDMVEEHNSLTVGVEFWEPKIKDPNAVDELDYRHLPLLLVMLRDEANTALAGSSDWVRRVHITVDGLKLLLRRRPQKLPPHVIWCDATGDPRLYELLLNMPVEVIQPHVEMQGTVHQVWTSVNNRTSIGAEHDNEKAKQIKLQIDRIRQMGGYLNPGVITYKATRDLFAGDGHFGAERGTNRLVDRDALIVIGTPQPPTPSLVETASMVFDSRVLPFNTTWTLRYTSYQGTHYEIETSGFWDDPDLHIILQQYREAELVQALHRARPLRQAVDVWLLTSLPLPGIQPVLYSTQELFGAPKGVDPYKWPAMLQWVNERLDTSGIVVSTDVTDEFVVNLDTARKYMKAMAQQLNLVVTTAPSTGRGRPAMAIVRPAECKVFGHGE